MRAVSLSVLFLITVFAYSQPGYRIDFTIKGLKDTTAYLAFYFQNQTWVKDTARVDSQGAFSFTGKQALPRGIFLLVLNKVRVFDFVVGADQQFSLETSTDDYYKNMVVKGDEDNRIFFENLHFIAESEPFAKVLQDSSLTEEQKKDARESMNTLYKKVTAFQQELIHKHAPTVTARLLKMNMPIEVPPPPKKPDGSIDSTFQLKYYRQHFFDNYDLGDDLTLRVPKVQYEEKVKEYLEKLFIQHPDTVTKAIERLVPVAKKNKDTYRFLLWKCLVNYQMPEIMGLDEVYVNLVNKYVVTGEMDFWLDKKTKQNVIDFASKVKRAMIGRQAPNLKMQNENWQPRALYDLKNKYSIVYFFKPTCGHCREETPKLVTFYNANKKKFDLEVFAVSTDTSMQDMRNFIREMNTPWITVNGPRSYLKTHFSELYYAETTPTVYILDEKKKIIARRIGVEQINGFLENYEKMMRKKASQVN